MRTLTGHKSNIRSLDFHPYGEFVASGSLDTNIKVRGDCKLHILVSKVSRENLPKNEEKDKKHIDKNAY